MDQRLIIELMRGVANGFDAARSNPEENPEFKDIVSNTVSVLNRILAENREFSIVLSDGAFRVGDLHLEAGGDPRLVSLISLLMEKGVGSITFKAGAGQNDIVHLFDVLVNSHADEEKHTDLADELILRGVQKIALNDVENVSLVENTEPRYSTHEETIKAIRALLKIVRERAAVSETKKPFFDVMKRIEQVSSADWHPYREAMVNVVDLLPVEKRVALLQDIEMRPFARSLLSRMKSRTLIELMTNWKRQGKEEQIVKVLGAVEKEQLREIVPQLRYRQLRVYRYLIHAGVDILAEDTISSTIEENDIESALQPYDEMSAAQNADLRAGALRSLSVFCGYLMRQKKYGMGRDVLMRISSTLERERSEAVVGAVISDLELLYGVLDEHKRSDLCETLLEPFGRILGRTDLSPATRKRVIQFLSKTHNPSVLHIIFSLLWESGLYPDVRSAIIGFKGAAVREAIELLRDAEDFSVRMKLIDVLKNIGLESIAVLTENLHAREWYLRRNIIRIFGEIGDKSVIPDLESMLGDEDYRVRLEVARTYGKLKYKEGLLKALEDNSASVKSEVLRGLRRMLDAEEVIDLLSRLGGAGDEVYVELLKIIDEKRIFEAVHWIGDLLKRIEWRKDAPANEIKVLGINTLAKLGGDDAKMILLDLRDDEDKRLSDLVHSVLKRIG
jgi:hypothetical protein